MNDRSNELLEQLDVSVKQNRSAIHELETTIASQVAFWQSTKFNVESMHQDIRDVKKHLNGTIDGSPGIVTRIDRLEQIEKARLWTIRAMAMGVIAIGSHLIEGWFKS